MRVVIRPSCTAGQKEVVLSVEQLRNQQERRLRSALEAWDTEKKRLEEAVARAQNREREFRRVSDDVQRKLDALNLVLGMGDDMEPELPVERALPKAASQPMLTAANSEITHAVESRISDFLNVAATDSAPAEVWVTTSSRPLFTAEQRARAGELSILQ